MNRLNVSGTKEKLLEYDILINKIKLLECEKVLLKETIIELEKERRRLSNIINDCVL